MTNSIQTAQQWLHDADAILVTASNGFSITEGLNLFAQDSKVKTVVGDLAEKYRLPNLLSAMSYNYPDALDRWRVYARVAEYYQYNYHPGELMDKLRQVIGDKPYFIWTSNVDHHFALADFDQLLEVEGNWQTASCSAHPKEHAHVDIREILHQIYEKDQAGTLTDADLPSCDECGAPLAMNVPGPAFQMDQVQVAKFESFINQYQEKKILILELGIGPQNQLIKAPSMQLVAGNDQSHYITINKGQLYIPDIIGDRSIGFSSTILDAFDALITGKGKVDVQGPTAPAPKMTAAEKKQQDEMLQKFYPSYTINRGIRPGELAMYMTVDPTHPSHLHTTQEGRSIMYSFGDPVNVHCFTQDGRYYMVKLGLNKKKGEVHGFYAEQGTFIAMEAPKKGHTGFSQVSLGLAANGSGQLLVPKIDQLTRLFPTHAALIKRLAVKD